jgi:LVIVD repeat
MKQLRFRNVAVLTVVLPLLLALSGGADGKRPAPVPWTGPVPKADCGPNDRVETGLQGQTTLEERLSGASMAAYNCNLELVGQFQGEGTKWQLATFDDCAYYGQWNNFDQPLTRNPGVPVIDASDPQNPQMSAVLTARAMSDPHESLKVNKKRKLLGATKGPGFGVTEATDRQFAFYDISPDCAHPRLLSDVDVPGHVGHAGDWAPDGLTYYGANIRVDSPVAPPRITGMDVSDPTQPKLLGFIPHHTHDLSVSKDGTRMYLAQAGNYTPFGFPFPEHPNGLVILDISDFQFRRPNPQATTISELFWRDGGVAQQTIPVTYRGRPHLIFTDETGAGPLFSTAFAARVEACAQGLAPFGFARIIDISDERNPKIISKLMLEVHDPANCPLTINDFTPDVRDLDFYGYSSHYCTVDRANNPRMMACGYLGAGLRVFDIRDPFHPREIAYYKPPAQRTKFLPGSALWADYGGDSGITNPDRTTDRVQTNMRFRKHKGELHIWFVGQDNGFQIVRFTKSMRELLGGDDDKGRGDDGKD